ncbi:unnamed protein product [Sphagnum troendelagicum]|uniref:RING-CH-type domain-containing protein n=1 Tax=Sphagnum troendelagicum TaxID=128251 RepID=A0ABP0UFT2_9BRYO
MLRRFNSLIKIPKVQHEAVENVHLRPASSVDSASLRPHLSYGEALDSFQVPQAWVRGAEPGVGQTSKTHQTEQGGDLQENNRLPVIQVTKPGAGKDGKEDRKIESDDAGDFRKPFLSVNKAGYEHLDPSDTSFSAFEGETTQLELQSGKEFTFPILPLSNRIEQKISNTVCAVGDQVDSGCTTIDISDVDTGKATHLAHIQNGYNMGRVGGGPDRTISNFSTDSMVECCRICQQHTEEQVIELGCFCRAELAKVHRSCIDQWFSNKGTNMCEVCQHSATNITPPSTLPIPQFWVWRIRAPNAMGNMELQQRGRRVGLFSSVLVVLGLVTAARLMLGWYRERAARHNIQQMEIAPMIDGPYTITSPSPTTAAAPVVPQDVAALV